MSRCGWSSEASARCVGAPSGERWPGLDPFPLSAPCDVRAWLRHKARHPSEPGGGALNWRNVTWWHVMQLLVEQPHDWRHPRRVSSRPTRGWAGTRGTTRGIELGRAGVCRVVHLVLWEFPAAGPRSFAYDVTAVDVGRIGQERPRPLSSVSEERNM